MEPFLPKSSYTIAPVHKRTHTFMNLWDLSIMWHLLPNNRMTECKMNPTVKPAADDSALPSRPSAQHKWRDRHDDNYSRVVFGMNIPEHFKKLCVLDYS